VDTEFGGDAKKAKEAWIAQERGTALPNPTENILKNLPAQQTAAPQQTRTASNPKVIKLD
jgi:hypothetical protein